MGARESCLTISAIKYPFLIHIFVQSERHPFVRCFVITLMQLRIILLPSTPFFHTTYFLAEMKYTFIRTISSVRSNCTICIKFSFRIYLTIVSQNKHDSANCALSTLFLCLRVADFVSTHYYCLTARLNFQRRQFRSVSSRGFCA